MIRSFLFFIFLVIFLLSPLRVWAQADVNFDDATEKSAVIPGTIIGKKNIFKTKYTTIYYSKDKDLDDFIWKLGGQRLEFMNETQIAANRIDRIVSRVQAVLDMYPEDFSIALYLTRETPKFNDVAYYDNSNKAIHISVDYASDGVIAHELAHAVIYQYFPTPPPSKAQEILSQYVDKHLWSDY